MTGLSVIIVGAGFGGLGAAIECANRGMSVRVYEKYPDSNSQGDILDIFPNAGRIIKRWDGGKVGQQIHDTGCSKIRTMDIYKYDGKYLASTSWAKNDVDHDITYAGHRGKLHSTILEYARTLVPEIHIGLGVQQYLENDTQAGVVLSNGETVWADCVIAADGARSIAREQVLGINDSDNHETSWAVFRTYLSTDEAARQKPASHGLLSGEKDLVRFWMSDTLYLMAFSWNQEHCMDIDASGR